LEEILIPRSGQALLPIESLILTGNYPNPGNSYHPEEEEEITSFQPHQAD